MLRIEELNAMDEGRFAASLSNVFEHAPWVASSIAQRRPFASRAVLQATMIAAVNAAPHARQMALVTGHPELAGRAMIDRRLTAESSREQKGAGLDRLTPEEFERFHALNDAYRRKFGFPFIMAIKGRDKADILAAFARRLTNDPKAEFAVALEEIAKIAAFRLADLVDA